MRQFGAPGQQQQNIPLDELAIRKADSQRSAQLIGGDDDSPSMGPGGLVGAMMGGRMFGGMMPMMQR